MKPSVEWTLVTGSVVFYLLGGGVIFMYLEYQNDMDQNEEIINLRKDAQRTLIYMDREFYASDTNETIIQAIYQAKEGIINRISEHCGTDLLGDLNETLHSKWNFYNSVVFSFTVITTIGYGHIAPSTFWGRSICMLYALIGIPVNGLLLAKMGEFFGRKLKRDHKRSKDEKYRRWDLFLEIMYYLVPGLLIFIIVPAAFFVLIEEWSYLDSIYFAFITLTTIGFGDFVAGVGEESTWLVFYRLMIIIWVVFGLGYVFMILGFITKGITHKYIANIIKMRLKKIKKRTKRNEKLSKDVEYMRRVVNELYMMKIQPIYNEMGIKDGVHSDHDTLFLQKTWKGDMFFSEPDLCNKNNYEEDPDFQKSYNCDDANCYKKMRRFSDTVLLRIDKEKTFEMAKSRGVDQKDFLIKMARILNQGNLLHDVQDVARDIEDDTGDDASDIGDEAAPLPYLLEFNETDEELEVENIPEETPEELELVNEDRCLTNLEQVIVHPNSKDGIMSNSIMEKVHVVVRKISAGSKNSEIVKSTGERRSRKVSRASRTSERGSTRPSSRNHSRERKISRDEHHRISGHSTRGHFLQDHLWDNKVDPKYLIPPDKASHFSHSASASHSEDEDNKRIRRISEESSDLEQIVSEGKVHHWMNQNIKSRSGKISLASTRGSHYSEDSALRLSSEDEADIPQNIHSRIKPSQRRKRVEPGMRRLNNSVMEQLESATLGDFIRALDAVHDKLNRPQSASQDDDRGLRVLGDGTEGAHESSTRRRRKMGVFNPGFSYSNNAFT